MVKYSPEYAQEERNRQQRLRIEAQNRKQKELADFKELLESAELFFKANMMRNYINAIMQRAVRRGGMSEELIDWIVWAKKKCKWYDPTENVNDEYLDEVDKMTLTFHERKSSY